MLLSAMAESSTVRRRWGAWRLACGSTAGVQYNCQRQAPPAEVRNGKMHRMLKAANCWCGLCRELSCRRAQRTLRQGTGTVRTSVNVQEAALLACGTRR